MGRPSLKKERFEEILDAFERCVACYGLNGATLEQVAAEAGLARPLIRHHVGNREVLVTSLIERYQQKSATYIKLLSTDLPEKNRFKTFLDRLFDGEFSDRNFVLVTEALIAAATDNQELTSKLLDIIGSVLKLIKSELKLEFKQASSKSLQVVASGILGIYFNVDSLSLLGDINQLRSDSKKAAQQLAQTLNH